MIEWLDRQPLHLGTDAYANLALSIVLAFFAIGVGWLGRFRGPAGWYALFGASFGLTTMAGGLNAAAVRAAEPVGLALVDASMLGGASTVWISATSVTMGVFGGLWAWSIAGLLGAYGLPRIWRRKGGWVAAVFTFIAASVYTADVLAIMSQRPPWAIVFGYTLQFATTSTATGWMFYGAGALAFSYLHRPDVGKAILAAAFTAYPILNAASIAGGTIAARLVPTIYFIAPVAALTIAIPWSITLGRVGGPGPRRVVVSALGFLVTGTLLGIYVPSVPLPGLARLFDVLLVAYAVMRLHYLDLDVKVRWGISKTTIAALFIAVFFIVSESAAAIFSQRWGTGIGIAAAGALVFAIAPIMRWADGLAAKAVPVPTASAEAFRQAVRMALNDGTIDRAKELQLADLANTLGLDVRRATEIRHEVET